MSLKELGERNKQHLIVRQGQRTKRSDAGKALLLLRRSGERSSFFF